ncbi:MAG: ABC transporter ATP-binding protein, partial [Acetatifactor sp.]|nr:ABC transporter ATP-binding protein [Acetatifactor sp.]
MEIVRVSGLKKCYGKEPYEVTALNGVDFSVEKGDFVAVLGMSGSGKTTLLNMLGGLDWPTEGKVWINGVELGNLKRDERTVFRRKNIGFIFQAYNLLPMLTAYENIVLPLKLDGRDLDSPFIEDIIRLLGLTEKKRSFPYEMSGGQQQRVAIARALAIKPSVILADEPTGNLDSKTSQEVIMLLKQVIN